MEGNGISYRVVPMEIVLKIIDQVCSPCQARLRNFLSNEFAKLNRVTTHHKIAEIMSTVSASLQIPVTEILSKSNTKSLVAARREIAVLARAQGYSLPQIGAALGKHHTTVLHLLKTAGK